LLDLFVVQNLTGEAADELRFYIYEFGIQLTLLISKIHLQKPCYVDMKQ